MSRLWTPALLTLVAWVCALSAFGIVAGNATGAVDNCTSRNGFAPVPFAFWPLLVASVVAGVADARVRARSGNRETRVIGWISLALIVAATLVSLVVFVIGYSCGLGE